MAPFRRFAFVLYPLLAAVTGAVIAGLPGCGGGGGGGSESNPARLGLALNPQHIDSGDRTSLQINISEIAENAFAVKIRFPNQLEYVWNSSFYEVAGDTSDTGPVDLAFDDTYGYLVYYITRSTFGTAGSGDLVLKLEGIADIPSGKIAVDADVDTDFDPENPQFDPQDEENIQVGPPPPKCGSSSSCPSSSSSKSSAASSSSASSAASSVSSTSSSSTSSKSSGSTSSK